MKSEDGPAVNDGATSGRERETPVRLPPMGRMEMPRMTKLPNAMQKLATNCGDPRSVEVSAVLIAYLSDSAHLDGLQEGIAAGDGESALRSAPDLVEAFPAPTLATARPPPPSPHIPSPRPAP